MKTHLIAIYISLAILAGCSKKPASTVAASPQEVKTETPATTAAAKTPPTQTSAQPEAAATTQETPAEDKSKPRLDYAPKPIYPSSLLDLYVEGEVRVQMRVTPEGRPEDIQIVEATDPTFGKALTNVLPLWRFLPAEKDGVPIARIVNIAIPFLITNRPADPPESISRGQAELIGFVRPQHPGKGKAKALVRVTLSSDTIVSNVEIEQKEGFIDEKALVESLSEWVFMPSKYSTNTQPTTQVEALITFTEAGNVLIQYPYPAPKPAN